MKILPIMASGMSGSLSGITASHNRGGQYFRSRVVPVNPATVAQVNARNRLVTFSQGWKGLTDAQRAAWNDFANENPVSDVLRQSQTLTGQQTYVKINTRLDLAGAASIATPPIGAPPSSLAGASATFDIGAGTTAIAWTNTPLGANEQLYIFAAVTNSQAITFVKNLIRFIGVSPAAQATGYDYQSQIEAVFGTLIVGQKVFLFPQVIDNSTGLMSAAPRLEGLVVSTV